MIASFPGTCNRCWNGYGPGDQIVRHKDGYIHARCASGQDDY